MQLLNTLCGLQVLSQITSINREGSIMQSILRYRRLGRRLRLEYESNQEKFIALSSSTQDSGTPSLADGQQVLRKDVEKALTADVNVRNAGTGNDVQPGSSSSQPSSPEPRSSTTSKAGLSRRDLTLACSIEGVNVRHRSSIETDDERVFVVGPGSNDLDFNPQNWTRSYRVWATCVPPT